jgi:hypothetical protein
MDLLAFQKSRDKELSDFETEYQSQKQKYAGLISNAIAETDPDGQTVLVQAILDINKELSAQVRDFVSKQSQGTPYDEKSVLGLTNELIKYQKEYESIRSSSDKVTTLKMILNQDTNKLSSMRTQFNVLLAIIGLAIVIIVFMIFKMSITQTVSSLAPQSALG